MKLLKKVKWLALLAIVAGALFVFIPKAKAEGVDFSVLPSKIELQAEMGSTLEKYFTVFNEASEETNYQIEVQDYSINQKNEFEYKNAGEDQYSLANWLKISQEKFTIPSKGSQKIDFSLEIPIGIVPHGYESIIFVKTIPKEGITGVNVAGRIGVTILAAVTGPADKTGLVKEGKIKDLKVDVSFPDFIEFSNGRFGLNFDGLFKPVIKATTIFHNSGNVFLTLKGSTKFLPETFGKFEEVDLPNLTTLPDTDRNLEAKWSTPSFLGKVKVESRVMFEGGEWISASKEVWIVSWNLIWFALAALLILLLILLATLRAHRKHKKLEKVMQEILEEEKELGKEKGKKAKKELKILQEAEEGIEEEARAKHPGWRVFGWLVLILGIVGAAAVLGYLLAKIASISLESKTTPTATIIKATPTSVLLQETSQTPQTTQTSLTPEETSATSPTPTKTKVAGENYTVQSGDTLFGIAQKFNVNWENLAKANDLESPYILHEGDVVVIPKK